MKNHHINEQYQQACKKYKTIAIKYGETVYPITPEQIQLAELLNDVTNPNTAKFITSFNELTMFIPDQLNSNSSEKHYLKQYEKNHKKIHHHLNNLTSAWDNLNTQAKQQLAQETTQAINTTQTLTPIQDTTPLAEELQTLTPIQDTTPLAEELQTLTPIQDTTPLAEELQTLTPILNNESAPIEQKFFLQEKLAALATHKNLEQEAQHDLYGDDLMETMQYVKNQTIEEVLVVDHGFLEGEKILAKNALHNTHITLKQHLDVHEIFTNNITKLGIHIKTEITRLPYEDFRLIAYSFYRELNKLAKSLSEKLNNNNNIFNLKNIVYSEENYGFIVIFTVNHTIYHENQCTGFTSLVVSDYYSLLDKCEKELTIFTDYHMALLQKIKRAELLSA